MTPEEFKHWKLNMTDMYMASPYLDEIMKWTQEEHQAYVTECVEQLKTVWDCAPYSKLCKKRGKHFVFVTLNFDEKSITKGTPLQIVQKVTSWKVVNKYAYAFEWRDHEAETGLHCHLILIGNCSKITQNCKRLKGPFSDLKKEFGTLLKYPMKYLKDKEDYISGKTFDPLKTDKKLLDEALRLKHNLLSVNNII